MCKHIKLVLPNIPGEAACAIEIINSAKYLNSNILGYSLSDHGDSGQLCLLCTHHDKVFMILKDTYKNFVKEQDVLIVSVPHKPGVLLPVLKVLAKNEINVRISYIAFKTDKNALLILTFNDLLAQNKAEKYLKEINVNILTKQP